MSDIQEQWSQHSKSRFKGLQVPRLDATRWSRSQSRILEGVTWLSCCPVVQWSQRLIRCTHGQRQYKMYFLGNQASDSTVSSGIRKPTIIQKEIHIAFLVSRNRSDPVARLICSVKTDNPIRELNADMCREQRKVWYQCRHELVYKYYCANAKRTGVACPANEWQYEKLEHFGGTNIPCEHPDCVRWNRRLAEMHQEALERNIADAMIHRIDQ
jgi:hypothetical protein